MEEKLHPLEKLFVNKKVKVYDAEEDKTFEGKVERVDVLPSNDDYEADSLVLHVNNPNEDEVVEIPVKWGTILEIEE